MARELYKKEINVAGGNSSGGTYYDYFTMLLKITENDYDIQTNKNSVNIYATFRNNKSWQVWGSYGNESCPKFTLIVYDNKTKKDKTYTAYLNNLGSFETAIIFNKDIELEHNNDGSLDISVTLKVERQSQVYYFPYDSLIDTGNLVLTTIPRATPAVKISANIEDTINIPLNPYISTFTHTVYIELGNVKGYLNASGNIQASSYKFTNPNIPFTLPKSFYNQFSKKYGTGTIKITTFNGNTQIGNTQIAELRANCLESRCKPSISGTVKDVNSKTINLTQNENIIIKYFSNAKVTFIASASSTTGDNSTIKAKIVEGITVTNNESTINGVTKKDFKVSVTNSRDFTTEVIVSTTGNLINYYTPKVNSNFERVSSTSNDIKLTYSTDMFKGSFGSVTNSATIKWYYRLETDSLWKLGGTLKENIITNVSETTLTLPYPSELKNGFDYQINYRFKIDVEDKLSIGTNSNQVTAGIPVISYGKDWFQFHVNPYLKNGMEIVQEKLDFTYSNMFKTNYIYNGKAVYRAGRGVFYNSTEGHATFDSNYEILGIDLTNSYIICENNFYPLNHYLSSTEWSSVYRKDNIVNIKFGTAYSNKSKEVNIFVYCVEK